jgi:hypothetical protein
MPEGLTRKAFRDIGTPSINISPIFGGEKMKFKLISLLVVSGILASCSHTPHVAIETPVKGPGLSRVVAQGENDGSKIFDFKLECGDTDEGYIDIDLSDYFKETYLSEKQKAEYEKEGFDYIIAGRNCGLGSWQGEGYSVLFLFESKKSREVFDLGPFSLFKAEIALQLSGEKFKNDRNNGKSIKTDLILTGGNDSDGKRNMTGENGAIKGFMTSERGSGKVKIIISPQ